MKSLLLSVVLFLSLSLAGSAQTPSDKGKHTDLVMVKLHQVEILAQIVPIGMTKDQIEKILPVLERIRADQRKVMSMEDDEISKIESKADEAIKGAIDKSETPSPTITGQIQALSKALATHRAIVLEDNANDLIKVLKTTLNQGQLTAMAKTVDAKVVNPTKPEEAKDDDRIKIYVKSFLLDPLAYDLLVKMSAKS